MNNQARPGDEPAGFGAALGQARAAQGLSLAELSRRTCYSASHISNVERGLRSPTTALAQACDQALDCHGALLRLADRAPAAKPWRPMGTLPPRLLPPVAAAQFVGRHAELAALNAILTHPAIPGASTVIGLDGSAGVGKTTLAATWAHAVGDQFPDGALFADLHGYTPAARPADPADVLDTFLQALGVPPPDVPPRAEARSGLLRTLLDGTRTLIVLDNAATSDQLHPLLPASPGCLVIVTSRHHLPSLAVRADAHRVVVPPLSIAESVELIGHIIGEDHLAAHRDAAERIARHCDGLPLAIRVAVVHATARAHTGLDHIAEALSTNALQALTITEDDVTVRAVFGCSYRLLTPTQAALFRAVGWHPGDVGLDAAMVLADTTEVGTRNLLGSLADAHLLDPIGPDRWRMHDLLRAYAVERAHDDDTAERRHDVCRQLIDYYAHTAHAASHTIAPLRQTPPLPDPQRPLIKPMTYTEAIAWCETETDTLIGITQLAYDLGDYSMAWRLPVSLFNFWVLRKRWSAWIATHQIGLAAAEHTNDHAGQAWISMSLAIAYRDLLRTDEADTLLHTALRLFGDLGDHHGQMWTLTSLGVLAISSHDLDDAEAHLAAAQQLALTHHDRHCQVTITAALGELLTARGKPEQARPLLKTAWEIAQSIHDPHGQAYSITRLADALLDLNSPDAIVHYALARAQCKQLGDRWNQAHIMHKATMCRTTPPSDQHELLHEALRIYEALDDPRAAHIRAELHTMHTNATAANPPPPHPNEGG